MDRSEKILKDIRKVNLRVDTLKVEIEHNIRKTQQENEERKHKKRTQGK